MEQPFWQIAEISELSVPKYQQMKKWKAFFCTRSEFESNLKRNVENVTSV